MQTDRTLPFSLAPEAFLSEILTPLSLLSRITIMSATLPLASPSCRSRPSPGRPRLHRNSPYNATLLAYPNLPPLLIHPRSRLPLPPRHRASNAPHHISVLLPSLAPSNIHPLPLLPASKEDTVDLDPSCRLPLQQPLLPALLVARHLFSLHPKLSLTRTQHPCTKAPTNPLFLLIPLTLPTRLPSKRHLLRVPLFPLI
jgi:hypothetical protein